MTTLIYNINNTNNITAKITRLTSRIPTNFQIYTPLVSVTFDNINNNVNITFSTNPITSERKVVDILISIIVEELTSDDVNPDKQIITSTKLPDVLCDTYNGYNVGDILVNTVDLLQYTCYSNIDSTAVWSAVGGVTGSTGSSGPALFTLQTPTPNLVSLTPNSVCKVSMSGTVNANIVESYPYNAVFFTFTIPQGILGNVLECRLENSGGGAYGLNFQNNTIFAYYNYGLVAPSIGTLVPNDVFTIAVSTTRVIMYRNGNNIYQNALVSGTNSLRPFMYLENQGDCVTNISYGYLASGATGFTGPTGFTGATGPTGPRRNNRSLPVALNFATSPTVRGFQTNNNQWTIVNEFIYYGTNQEDPININTGGYLAYTTNSSSFYRFRLGYFVLTSNFLPTGTYNIIATSNSSNTGIVSAPRFLPLYESGPTGPSPSLTSLMRVEMLSTNASGITGVTGRNNVVLQTFQLMS